MEQPLDVTDHPKVLEKGCPMAQGQLLQLGGLEVPGAAPKPSLELFPHNALDCAGNQGAGSGWAQPLEFLSCVFQLGSSSSCWNVPGLSLPCPAGSEEGREGKGKLLLLQVLGKQIPALLAATAQPWDGSPGMAVWE